MSTVAVLLPLPFDKAFDYAVPEGMRVAPGDYVRVPFGSRAMYGVVWGEGQGDVPKAKLKSIAGAARHVPPMPDAMRGFLDWVAWYTLAPKGMVLKMAMSVADALHTPGTMIHYTLAEGAEAKTAARQKIAALLADGYARTAADIAAEAGVAASTVRGFAEAGGLVAHAVEMEAALPDYDLTIAPPQLSAHQREAAAHMAAKLGQGFSVTLLDGVTGSGKTEVYFDTIARVLGAGSGEQVLVLLPEIALSVQWLERFRARFGDAPHVWHSSVPTARKRETWRAVANGKARLVVGARSALFLPFRNLRLIVVDEEQEQSYKQEEGVMYQARDMAVVRAQREAIPLLLVSATPSLETAQNVAQGKYAEVHLPQRHGTAELPQVELVDMRAHRPGAEQWISAPLREAVAQTLAAGRQAMLFINRRGYAPLILCRACGHRFACPHCSAWLVEHKRPPRLQCHHCDFRPPPPSHCIECGTEAEEALVSCGPGAERLAAEAEKAFPDAHIGLMTSDAVPTPEAAEKLIGEVAAGEINLLIGTQMMAKGHHFPSLALVGVVDADLGLAGGDLRAGERTWQLLHQLAGRAGRAEHAGRVLLQTYLPDHPVIQALLKHDRDGFMALESEARRQAGMPPFGRLAGLIVEGPQEAAVQQFARKIAQTAPHYHGMQLFGPSPAPLAILRGKYRYRLLLKCAREANLPRILREWLLPLKPPASVRLKVDVDPYGFM